MGLARSASTTPHCSGGRVAPYPVVPVWIGGVRTSPPLQLSVASPLGEVARTASQYPVSLCGINPLA